MKAKNRQELFDILYRTINNVEFYIKEEKIEELEIGSILINELGCLRGIYYTIEALELTTPSLERILEEYWTLQNMLLQREKEALMNYYAKKQKEMKNNEQNSETN